ncbi:MAG TPA: formate hydrogenlyase [Candidatus Accumulibacter sp.]|nr:formate hydrogenlyase [Accumulibacter sp.]
MWRILRQIARNGIRSEAPPAGNDALRVDGEQIQREILAILGQALSIREVDAGSCNACELEINALNNPYYNIEGLGIRFVASPRHADMLLVTGPVARNMELALRRTYEATPAPKLVVAVGDCGWWSYRRHWRQAPASAPADSAQPSDRSAVPTRRQRPWD